VVGKVVYFGLSMVRCAWPSVTLSK